MTVGAYDTDCVKGFGHIYKWQKYPRQTGTLLSGSDYSNKNIPLQTGSTFS